MSVANGTGEDAAIDDVGAVRAPSNRLEMVSVQ